MHRDCRGHHDGAWTGIARVGVGPAAGRVAVLRAYVGHDKHQRRAGAEPAPFARVGGRAQRTGTPRYTIDVSSTSERSGPCVGTTLTLLTHRRPARPPNGHPHHRDRRRPRPLLRRVQLPEQRHARADGRRVQRPPRASASSAPTGLVPRDKKLAVVVGPVAQAAAAAHMARGSRPQRGGIGSSI